MTVYFDKENFISYLKTVGDSSVGVDTLRMVKNHLEVHLNFSLSELDEDEGILLGEFTSGVAKDFKLTHSNNNIVRPLKKDSFPQFNGIYLLNVQAEVQKIKDLCVVLIGYVNEEVYTLKKLLLKEDYVFHKERVIGGDITPDDHLSIEDLPFRTLVIVDRYMFKGPEEGGNIGLFDFNIDKILKNAFQGKRGPSKLIFIYQIRLNVAKTDSKYDAGPDFPKLIAKIKKAAHKYCPAPEIYLLGTPFGQIDDEHDRFIITNYLRIKSGDSLIYFNSKDEILSKSKTVDFYSLGSRDYRYTTKIIVEKLKIIIDDTLKSYPQYCKVPEGTERSNVIDF